PLVITAAAAVGYVAGRARPALLGRPRAHGDSSADDHAEPLPSRAQMRRRLVRSLLVWLVPVALLIAAGGLGAALAGVFTLTALITFGGAYAVLPFVASQAVHHYGWLSPRDMIAGLALGESTPGPLIMVNTFVGFLAGYHIEGGLAWGLLGATIATLCTF